MFSEDVDAVHRQQDLVHLEHACVLLERQHLKPQVSAPIIATPRSAR